MAAHQRLERLRSGQSYTDEAIKRWHDNPVLFAQEALGVDLWELQANVATAVAEHHRVAVKAGRKIGKALALDTPIPTPGGWSTMGELKVGDAVFDDRGKPCTVVAATPVMCDRPCYAVTFDDGTRIVADAEHGWLTWTHSAKKAHSRAANPTVHPSVVTTEELRRTLVHGKRDDRNHSVANAAPIELPAAELLIDPYVLGAWLGDGNKHHGAITSADPRVLGEVSSAGYETVKRKAQYLYGILGLQKQLRAEGLLCNKHVPPAYMRGSVQQRRDLLAGLLDTDGTVTPDGKVSFTNTTRHLAEAVYELAASLGFKPHWRERRAKLDGKDCGPAYVVGFTPHEPVFRLERKLARQHSGKTKQRWVNQRMVVSVEPVGSVPVRCIQVDSPSSLFLCSRAFIPTHNSLLVACLALWWACTRLDAQVLITAPGYSQIRDITWRELRKMAHRAREIGVVHIPEAALDPATGVRWPDGRFIVGRSTDRPERMQGYGGPACLFLIDEASGVSQDIVDALEGNAAGGSADDPEAVAKFVLTGNPTQGSGALFDAFNRHQDHWRGFTIRSDQTPNAQLGRTVIRGLATADWLDQRRVPWCYPDGDMWRVHALGEFPKGGMGVIPLHLVMEAQQRDRSAIPYVPRLMLGVDVARFGDDLSVSIPVRGYLQIETKTLSGCDEHQVAGMVLEQIQRLHRKGEPLPLVKVDATGRLGVSSILRAARNGTDPVCDVVEVNSADPAQKVELYKNIRSELWFDLADWLRDGGAIDPDDYELAGELTAPTYSFEEGTGSGRRVVEQKKQFKKRLGRSPDRADALALAVYRPPDAGHMHVPDVPFDVGFRQFGGRGFG